MGMNKDQDAKGTVGKPEKKRFRETTKRLREGKKKHLKHRASLEWRLDQRRVCETARALGDISLRTRLECAGLETARARFSWKTLGSRLSALYQNANSKPPRIVDTQTPIVHPSPSLTR